MNDLQKIVDNAPVASRNESLKKSPQMLLGEMIVKLEGMELERAESKKYL